MRTHIDLGCSSGVEMMRCTHTGIASKSVESVTPSITPSGSNVIPASSKSLKNGHKYHMRWEKVTSSTAQTKRQQLQLASSQRLDVLTDRVTPEALHRAGDLGVLAVDRHREFRILASTLRQLVLQIHRNRGVHMLRKEESAFRTLRKHLHMCMSVSAPVLLDLPLSATHMHTAHASPATEAHLDVVWLQCRMHARERPRLLSH